MCISIGLVCVMGFCGVCNGVVWCVAGFVWCV